MPNIKRILWSRYSQVNDQMIALQRRLDADLEIYVQMCSKVTGYLEDEVVVNTVQ